MDDFVAEFARRDDLNDVLCLVVLRKGKEEHLLKMTDGRRLPVLIDSREADFEGKYGLTSSRPWRILDRRGCIAADSLGLRLAEAADPEPLGEVLRRIDH